MPDLSVNGIHLHFEECGEGPPLVLLHGLNSDLSFMRGEMEALSRDFRVVALDSRGHGRSERPAAFTLADHAADVLALLDALGLERAFLMGTSMGSYVAQAVALSAPERTAKLVLVVPKSNGRTSSVERLLAEHEAELAGRSQAEIQAFVSARLFAPGTPAQVRARAEALFAARRAAGLEPTAQQALAASAALRGFDFRPGLPELPMPLLVISGRHDPLNPPPEGEALARLVPGARLVVLEESGHLPSLEQPEELITVVRDFLLS